MRKMIVLGIAVVMLSGCAAHFARVDTEACERQQSDAIARNFVVGDSEDAFQNCIYARQLDRQQAIQAAVVGLAIVGATAAAISQARTDAQNASVHRGENVQCIQTGYITNCMPY